MLISKTNQFRARSFMAQVFKRAAKIQRLDGGKHDKNPEIDTVEIRGKRFVSDHHRVSSTGTAQFDMSGRPISIDLKDTRAHNRETSTMSLTIDGEKTTIKESLTAPSYTRGTVVTFMTDSRDITGFDEYLEA